MGSRGSKCRTSDCKTLKVPIRHDSGQENSSTHTEQQKPENKFHEVNIVALGRVFKCCLVQYPNLEAVNKPQSITGKIHPPLPSVQEPGLWPFVVKGNGLSYFFSGANGKRNGRYGYTGPYGANGPIGLAAAKRSTNGISEHKAANGAHNA